MLLEKMQSLLSTKNREEMQEKFLEDYVEKEKEVNKVLTKKTKFTIHDMWKKQRDFIHHLITEVKGYLEWIDGYSEVNEKMEQDLQTHREAIATEMSVDFDAKYSEHDITRNEMRYIKNLLHFPVKTIDEEQKKRDEEWFLAEPMQETEGLDELTPTTAEDTALIE